MRLPFFRRKQTHSDWMMTYSGVVYWPASPRAQDVRIQDIAHHLSMLCRFTGAVREFYSVAEHSIHVSRLVPPHMALLGLLHDAPEAYLQDISRPLKRSLPDYRRLERLNWLEIAKRFGLPAELPPEVHEADAAVLLREQEELMPPRNMPQGFDARAAVLDIFCWSPASAEARFMERFYEITTALAHPARTCGYGRPILPEMATC